MPQNTGTTPDHDMVDLKFRNGVVKRNQDPAKWNWKPLTHHGKVIESPWDILSWQKIHVDAG